MGWRYTSDLEGPDFPELNLDDFSNEQVNPRAFEIYIYEAKFFWRFLRTLMAQNSPSSVLEIGSGIGLLSLLCKNMENSVTSIEPESSGFDRMSEYRRVLLKTWGNQDLPTFRKCFINELSEDEDFDFIFCLNVLEHVLEPEVLIAQIYDRLRPGGLAWFVLPNYSFPYEQHFEIPIVITKSITEKIFLRRILTHPDSPDPKGLWEELSWPTQRRLAKFLRSRDFSHKFRRDVLRGYFDRLEEPVFLTRKGHFFRIFRPIINGLKPVVALLPYRFLPVIEFTISKK